MKVTVDPDLCQGHAVCENEAPEVFSVPKHGTVTILMALPPDELRDKVHLAVKYCPTGALRLEEN
jgi:ferredoxin